MLKWEYYRRFKERFQKYLFLEQMPFGIVFFIYILLKVIQGVTLYWVISSLWEKKYSYIIVLVVYVLYWIIDLRDGQEKIKTIVSRDRMNEFYLANTNYSENKVVAGIVLSEVIWGVFDILGVHIPVLIWLLGEHNSILKVIALEVLIIFALHLLKTIVMFYIYKKEANGHKGNNMLFLVVKLALLYVFVWFGSCVSEFILSCPLNEKKDLMDKLKLWVNGIEDISFQVKTEHIKMLFYLSFVIIITCLLIFALKNMLVIIRNKLVNGIPMMKYELFESKGLKIRDFGLISIGFMGIGAGILYENGLGENTMTVLLFIVTTLYTISWLVDDIFSFHNELLIDNEERKLLYWKNNYNKVIKYKFIMYVLYYVTAVSIIIGMYFIFIYRGISDLSYCIYNMLIACTILCIGFVNINMAIVNSPQKITEDYDVVKYNQERMLEKSFENGKVIVLSICGMIPSIFLACGEITYTVFWILQGAVLIFLIVYFILNYRVMSKSIMKAIWITKLFDEEKIQYVDES